jgi:Holliday junction DNA helicase RuvA
MIASISGTVRRTTELFAVIEASGIGYKTFMTPADLMRLAPGDTISIGTYLAVREDALDLYGFLEVDDSETFEILLKVPGIGPRSALGVMSHASTETIRTAVAHEKPEYLTKNSGIGKKTAEKIVRELAGKMSAPETPSEHFESDEEAQAALVAIGYSEREARDVLRTIDPSISDTRGRLREALKMLGGSK